MRKTIIIVSMLLLVLGGCVIFNKVMKRNKIGNQIVQYLNNKYNEEFEIVKFVKQGKPYDVVGNGWTFYDEKIDGKEYIEYIAKSKTTNITFKVAYNNYSGINYYDFYLVKYAEKVYNKKINNLKFNPHIELDMDLNPQFIYDLESEYYNASNLNISFDDLDSIDLLQLKYNLIYDFPSEVGVEDETLFSEFVSSINEVKKNIGATNFGNYVTIKTKNTNISIEIEDWTGLPFWDSYISVLDKRTRRVKAYYYNENGYMYSDEYYKD